ncbi:flagellin [Pengzhenrongella frigida]|uniref:Flagellin n=1 Tax=Pengzhenrongella frigida TaxID=1259133 RepID=A0A4Q5MWR2_9MICO|nr:flagellin [Cellulomonas sp. HLT2-17]RYV50030.1 flagellin [Cellulomonas sp. HLT2-17]
MALSINTNVAALNAYRNLNTTQNDLSKSLEKLSSGFRINRAADDAAGLAISEGMRSQIGGIKMGVRNAQDGISLVQTAEGALNETHSILQRMRDLSVQASNSGSLNADAKTNIQTEVNQLNSELTRIADTTKFNGSRLLDGTYSSGTFQVGANAGETITVNLSGTGMSAAGLGTTAINVTGTAVGATTAAVVNAVAGTAGTVTTASTGGSDLATAAGFDDLNGTITVGSKSLDLSTIKYAAPNGTTDVADRTTVLQNAVTAAFGSDIASATVTGSTLVVTGKTPAAGATASAVAAASVTFTQASGASEAIGIIDKAITTVSSTRSNLGAVQNRFEHTINNLNVAVENLTASESRIRDTDMASEMISFTRSQILSQAGTAMLAQAKSIPQGVLQLLQ